MGYSYQPLWNLLAEKGITKTQLREKVGISTSTLAKLSANKPVAPEVIAKICEAFGCGTESIMTYASEIELFMLSIKDEVLDCEYTVYFDTWPECRFRLTQQQVNFFSSVPQEQMKKILLQCEMKANAEHQPNAGIIGTTRLRFDAVNGTLIINGSFAVVENFIPWFLSQIN